MKKETPTSSPLIVRIDKCPTCHSIVRIHEDKSMTPSNPMDIMNFPISEMRLSADMMMTLRLIDEEGLSDKATQKLKTVIKRLDDLKTIWETKLGIASPQNPHDRTQSKELSRS